MNNVFSRPLLIAVEKWYTWHESRRLLKLYWTVRAEQPRLQGVALYEQVVARQGNLGDLTPDTIVQHATESFATWPVERPLRFRDVVHFLAVDGYLRSYSGGCGTLSDMRRMVDRVIPETL